MAVLDDLIVVAGTRPGSEILPRTFARSHDGSTWIEGEFADDLSGGDYQVFDVGFTEDGARAVLVGAAAGVPSIWFADVMTESAPGDGSPVATGSPSADESPAATASPSAEESPVGGRRGEDDATAAIGAPRRFRTADFPAEAPPGSALHDVISGGPGYIAVGGGSWRPRQYDAVAWVSENGMSWQTAQLEGDAATGAMEGVAALPGGGYVAVGRGSEPGGGRSAEPPNALVWHSADGETWSAVPSNETFSEAIMYDTATTDEGVIAVGCKADSASLCSVGQAWTSPDGIEWDLEGAVPILPFTVSVNGGTVATGGTDEQSDRTNGRAAAAVKAGEQWSATGPLRKRWSDIAGSSTLDDGFAMVGSRLDPDGVLPVATLFVTADGESWDRVSGSKFRRMQPMGMDISGDLMLLAGIRPSGDIGYPPVVLWSRDMENFRESRFPDDVSGEGLELNQSNIAEDGLMAIVVGAYQQRPWIWYSELE